MIQTPSAAPLAQRLAVRAWQTRISRNNASHGPAVLWVRGAK